MSKKNSSGANLAVIDHLSAIAAPKQSMIGGGLEGASRTQRETMSWNPAIISPDQQIQLGNKDLADARARDMIQNDGYSIGTMAIHRDSIVGAQYRLNAKPNWRVLGVNEAWAREWQREVEARFNLVADSPENYFDAAGINTLTGMIRLAISSVLMTGEVVATAEWLRQANRPFSTAIQMISPTRLSNPDGMMDNRFLRSGVRQDMYGRPISYFIKKTFPGAEYGADDWKWIEVPATKPWGRRQVIHIYEQLQPDQSRGVSDMVSVLKQMRMTKNFQEIVLQNAVVNASYAAAIESELPSEVVFSQMGLGQNGFKEMLGGYMGSLMEYIARTKNIAIDGVKIPHLFPGTRLKMQPMGTPGGVGTDYEESLLRNIAAGLGLSYEQFSRDYTKTNYSSARASMGETWKFMNSRKKMVADRFASHIYSLWLEEEIAAGNVPLPPGKTRDWFYAPLVKDALCKAEWIGASRGQIDEKKETEAAILRIKNGLSTYEIEIARLGGDWREVFDQRAEEEGIIREKKLNFSGQPVQEDTAENGSAEEKTTAETEDATNE
ncbi:portal protein [Cronobacter phage JC01]|uniref:Portal protein n=1 Tax=Cronobacter phage JC01 TaxID=2729575 RepID=A0A6M3YL01_9CAUD|nr:portal protein [Cronobacter phage JC01]QJI52232.1 portal protein [Cronobacter phage JC01]